jgi:hypothetical protein
LNKRKKEIDSKINLLKNEKEITKLQYSEVKEINTEINIKFEIKNYEFDFLKECFDLNNDYSEMIEYVSQNLKKINENSTKLIEKIKNEIEMINLEFNRLKNMDEVDMVFKQLKQRKNQ